MSFVFKKQIPEVMHWQNNSLGKLNPHKKKLKTSALYNDFPWKKNTEQCEQQNMISKAHYSASQHSIHLTDKVRLPSSDLG
uniref:Uncharacterized protein n=1 Tax=Arion vulgaris TaxID=1028688 RepID=A0A0B7BUC1_9EUPU